MNNLLTGRNIPVLHSTKILVLLLFFSINVFAGDSIKLIIPTFLGNDERNYYGNEAPEKLDVIWKTSLGCGKTVIPNKTQDTVMMCGAGWTGQALLVEDGGKLYIIQGAYD
ncbi:MAG: hypothetical protein PHE56_07205, partial [Bacteroidales bacterium]|nr:hypothetical protein [Bacteroidales bacterium]